MRSMLPMICCAAVLALVPAPAAAAQSEACAINTGLDPACPITAVGVANVTDVLSATATEDRDAIFGSWSLQGTRQLTVTLPVYDHLGIAGVGNAFGSSDLAIQYTQAFGGRKRLTQFAGITTSFATGSTNSPEFTKGFTNAAPLYGLSYAFGKRITLVAIGQYAFDFGGTKVPFAPRTQAFSVTPRAIVDLSQKHGFYVAADERYGSITGDERYQEYRADAEAGIVRKHINFAFAYSVPTSRFSREYLFYRTIGVRLSWQR